MFKCSPVVVEEDHKPDFLGMDTTYNDQSSNVNFRTFFCFEEDTDFLSWIDLYFTSLVGRKHIQDTNVKNNFPNESNTTNIVTVSVITRWHGTLSTLATLHWSQWLWSVRTCSLLSANCLGFSVMVTVY